MRLVSSCLLITSMIISSIANGEEPRNEIIKLETKSLCTALAMFKLDQRHWPTTEEGLNVLTFPSLNDNGESGKPYLNIIKKDPWGNDYIYSQSKKRFKLVSMGKDGILNSPDDIGPNICYPKWSE